MGERGFIVGSQLHTNLQQALLGWYYQHKRDLPWRGETEAYRILLSEVLLQQTRVEQVIPYYHRFLAAFPSLAALAQAELEAVLRVWQGAGYYARARHLHRLAQTVSELPSSYSALLELPGLGPYTAAAVASIAFGEPVAAVDGNVRRVLSRWMAWEAPSPKQLQAKADELLAPETPGDWNQAMMELGATVCLPQTPRCERCPVARFCRGKAEPGRYPTPKKRVQTPVEAVALVWVGPDGLYLERREGHLLGGLWGVPVEEGAGALERLLQRFGLEGAERVGTVQHAFTHRKLRVQVYRVPGKGLGDAGNRPLSRLDQKILELAQADLLPRG
ncbi:MAG: A/G-specific adenine glycosylase [Thermaceae bacterium]|jgi:A/G-specific adenine glycosylase|nr:A/G-specific adenine glycosylase [Thermaceae bacterium]